MKIKSAYPIMYQDKSNFSSANGMEEALSTPARVKFFQGWVNKFRKGNLLIDGKAGKKTQAAWDKYSDDFKKAAGMAASAVASFKDLGDSSASINAPIPKVDKLGNALNKYSQIKDSGVLSNVKNKLGLSNQGSVAPMNVDYGTSPSGSWWSQRSTGQKVAIIAVPVVLISVIAYFALRNPKGKGK